MVSRAARSRRAGTEPVNTQSIRHSLAERVKELAALHRTARLLQDTDRPFELLAREFVDGLPAAWQYPEIARARVRMLGGEWAGEGFRETPWMQSARVGGDTPEAGIELTVGYLEPCPEADEGPFLHEERELVDSLAEMLRLYVGHHRAARAAALAQDELERRVARRTAELRAANEALTAEIEEHRRARREIERHREQLVRLASELSLAEERERRAIAADLHDHLGQALAFVKLRLTQLAGNAVFCGFESGLQEILELLDRAIRYTRSLTGELSPPVLHELGLAPALEWLGERFASKHRLPVDVEVANDLPVLSQSARVMLFKSVHELLTNVVKHARAGRARVALRSDGAWLVVSVADDGVGFDPVRAEALAADAEGGAFGLFSIRERARWLGGRLEVASRPGAGAALTLHVPLARAAGAAA